MKKTNNLRLPLLILLLAMSWMNASAQYEWKLDSIVTRSFYQRDVPPEYVGDKRVFRYDSLMRVSSYTRFLIRNDRTTVESGATCFEYDGQGNLSRQWDCRAGDSIPDVETRHEYDEQGRRKAVWTHALTDSLSPYYQMYREEYTRDKEGHLTSLSYLGWGFRQGTEPRQVRKFNRAERYEYTYDRRGRLTSRRQYDYVGWYRWLGDQIVEVDSPWKEVRHDHIDRKGHIIRHYGYNRNGDFITEDTLSYTYTRDSLLQQSISYKWGKPDVFSTYTYDQAGNPIGKDVLRCYGDDEEPIHLHSIRISCDLGIKISQVAGLSSRFLYLPYTLNGFSDGSIHYTPTFLNPPTMVTSTDWELPNERTVSIYYYSEIDE